jgi:3',5'-cyclic-AMP phosphodiesterase
MTTTLQILTDAHTGSAAEGHASGRKLTTEAAGILAGVLEEGQLRGALDGVIDLGDLIEHAGSRVPAEERASTDLENFSKALRLFEGLSMPSLHCIGNHPLMSATDQMITQALGLDKPYYARDIGDHRVVMLHSRFQHRENTEEHRSGSGIYIDSEQLAWLKNEIERSEKDILVCCHHPISDQDLRGNVWFEKFPQCALMNNREHVQEILAQSGKVVAVLNGHTHWNHLTVDKFGTPHVTLQSLSENFRNDGTPAGTYGIAILKGAAFNLEIFGKDAMLRNAVDTPQQIVSDLAATYNSIAAVYDQKTSQFGGPEQRMFDGLVELLKPGHGSMVVDFGCGPGRDVPYYASRKFHVTGVDASRDLLAIAQARSPEQHFICSDFATAPLTPNSTAIAIHNSSLQHVPRAGLKQALQKVFDTLEPDGVFYCHYRSGEGESLSISTEYGRPIARFIALYTEQEMEAALRNVGFQIIKSDTFDHKYDGLKGKVVQYKTRTWARKPNL